MASSLLHHDNRFDMTVLYTSALQMQGIFRVDIDENGTGIQYNCYEVKD